MAVVQSQVVSIDSDPQIAQITITAKAKIAPQQQCIQNISKFILSSSSYLQSQIHAFFDTNPQYILFQPKLHCNPETDHLFPKNLWPLFSSFISQSINEQKLQLLQSSADYIAEFQKNMQPCNEKINSSSKIEIDNLQMEITHLNELLLQQKTQKDQQNTKQLQEINKLKEQLYIMARSGHCYIPDSLQSYFAQQDKDGRLSYLVKKAKNEANTRAQCSQLPGQDENSKGREKMLELQLQEVMQLKNQLLQRCQQLTDELDAKILSNSKLQTSNQSFVIQRDDSELFQIQAQHQLEMSQAKTDLKEQMYKNSVLLQELNDQHHLIELLREALPDEDWNRIIAMQSEIISSQSQSNVSKLNASNAAIDRSSIVIKSQKLSEMPAEIMTKDQIKELQMQYKNIRDKNIQLVKDNDYYEQQIDQLGLDTQPVPIENISVSLQPQTKSKSSHKTSRIQSSKKSIAKFNCSGERNGKSTIQSFLEKEINLNDMKLKNNEYQLQTTKISKSDYKMLKKFIEVNSQQISRVQNTLLSSTQQNSSTPQTPQSNALPKLHLSDITNSQNSQLSHQTKSKEISQNRHLNGAAIVSENGCNDDNKNDNDINTQSAQKQNLKTKNVQSSNGSKLCNSYNNSNNNKSINYTGTINTQNDYSFNSNAKIQNKINNNNDAQLENKSSILQQNQSQLLLQNAIQTKANTLQNAILPIEQNNIEILSYDEIENNQQSENQSVQAELQEVIQTINNQSNSKSLLDKLSQNQQLQQTLTLSEGQQTIISSVIENNQDEEMQTDNLNEQLIKNILGAMNLETGNSNNLQQFLQNNSLTSSQLQDICTYTTNIRNPSASQIVDNKETILSSQIQKLNDLYELLKSQSTQDAISQKYKDNNESIQAQNSLITLEENTQINKQSRNIQDNKHFYQLLSQVQNQQLLNQQDKLYSSQTNLTDKQKQSVYDQLFDIALSVQKTSQQDLLKLIDSHQYPQLQNINKMASGQLLFLQNSKLRDQQEEQIQIQEQDQQQHNIFSKIDLLQQIFGITDQMPSENEMKEQLKIIGDQLITQQAEIIKLCKSSPQRNRSIVDLQDFNNLWNQSKMVSKVIYEKENDLIESQKKFDVLQFVYKVNYGFYNKYSSMIEQKPWVFKGYKNEGLHKIQEQSYTKCIDKDKISTIPIGDQLPQLDDPLNEKCK